MLCVAAAALAVPQDTLVLNQGSSCPVTDTTARGTAAAGTFHHPPPSASTVQTSATQLFPLLSPSFAPSFCVSLFPSFSLFLLPLTSPSQSACWDFGVQPLPGFHRVWATPNKQTVNKIPSLTHIFSPLPPLILSFFHLEFNVGFCLFRTPPPPPPSNSFQL